jgi:Putative transcriptional repressor regulating G2/M transition
MQRLDILYPLTLNSIFVNRFQCEQTMEEHGAQEKQKVGSMSDDSNDEQIDCHDFMPEQKPNVVPSSWKPFGCETCGKRFTLRGSLKTHEKLHGFRPTYNCDVCGKTFKVASGLKSHASLHSGQKPFHCDICGKSFTLKGSLKTHSALHSTVRESFRCYICGKTYKGRASLKSHYAMHADKKSFMCEVCDKDCTLSSLTLHAPLCCNSKPHVCFDIRSHLMQHITSHSVMLL